MSEVKPLVASIVDFLKRQLDSSELNADLRESLEVGIQCLESAFEISNDSTLQKVDLLKMYKEHVAQQGITTEMKAEAEKLKNDGNNLMKADKYKEAYEKYTSAIEIDSQNAVFFCNRAAALLKLNDYQGAVTDCLAALAIDGNYGKAHGRLGLALSSLNRHVEARAAYARALQLEPGNESYQNNLRLTEEKLSSNPQQGGGMDFGSLLQNPALMNMASEMLSDPAMQNLISGLLGGTAQPNSAESGVGAGGGGGGMSSLLEAGQLLAQQMQQANPDLVDQLRRQINQGQPPQNPPPSQ